MHPTSIIDENVEIGHDTKIWHFSHIQFDARIGKKCSFDQNVNVSSNVKIGDGYKVKENASIHEGIELVDYVFCGSSMVFTNDFTTRARFLKVHEGHKRTIIHHDTILGANSTVVCEYEHR